ncbi:anaerobic ribonucleoside-triphosphate reductase activating protein [Calidifontibacillus erzurumensis]|uniref:Anaerobic ribonucleoside-triphosphate reductase-activating protein n=1 Tax=Calidifontibacillus erzurumensis TaxID=2741433 RepID=A0A8J8KD99_9BACI|nr:anaerobic ribonucleoside-triphosphate reductase activating protein [Calidifontibacillus erzurumensis]NSL52808.1 anaerobic ribonucleoside-triphosphate reductase activating protein [Calidifontibacillus erzurumensis]
MKIMKIDTDCTDNGNGIRTVIYVSGCSHYCEGCHNPSSWNVNNGIEYSINELINIIEDNSIADVTISGGDSLTFQYEDTLMLVKEIKVKTRKNIWLYTGYVFEEIPDSKKEILRNLDVLVDGRFELSKKNLQIMFRGSSNQRIIDVQRSIKEGITILWKDGQYI